MDFGRALRARGLPVTQSEVGSGLAALAEVDVGERAEVRLALRTAMIHRRDDIGPFNEVFDAYWQIADLDEDAGGGDGDAQGAADGPPRPRPPEPGPPSPDADPDAPDDVVRLAAYSPAAALVRRDFGSLSLAEEQRLADVCAVLARRLATRLSRRLRAAPRGVRIDLRRSMRAALGTGGDLLRFARRRRRLRHTRVTVICDVSGSMEAYSRFLLLFVRALQRTLPRVEAFTFSTSLQRVTPVLRRPDASVALRAFFAESGDWAGGTRIGASLREFRRDHAGLVDRHTLLLICSDGLDTGDTELLATEMAKLRRRAAGVLWLNPLAADPAYRPLSLGMQAAMPSVDVLAPAGTLANLLELETHVGVIVGQGGARARPR